MRDLSVAGVVASLVLRTQREPFSKTEVCVLAMGRGNSAGSDIFSRPSLAFSRSLSAEEWLQDETIFVGRGRTPISALTTKDPRF